MFDKDFVMKASLVLADIADIKFAVANSNVMNMNQIEPEWPRISSALKLAVNLVASFGRTGHTFASINSVIPIAYYVLKRRLYPPFVHSEDFQADRETIRIWLATSLMRGVFSASGDTILSAIRAVIEDSTG